MSNDDLDRTVIMPTPGRRGPGGTDTPGQTGVPGQPATVPGQPAPIPGQAPVVPGTPLAAQPIQPGGQPLPGSPPPPGIAPQPTHAPQGNRDSGEGVSLNMVGSSGQNHLINAATMIFSLARQLRNTMQHEDVNGLLAHVIELVKTYEKNCIAAGITPDVAYEARYILCAFIDEIVLNTPWGAGSTWSHQGLLSTLHSDTTGGERFFQILARKSDVPAQNLPLLELMYHCLRLGFQGKFAIQQNGQAALDQICAGLYKTIRELKGDADNELSPHWTGVVDGRPMVAKLIPWWVVGAVLGGILTITFVGFLYTLNDDSQEVFSDMGKLGREVPQMIKTRQTIKPLVDPVVTGVDLDQVSAKLNDFLGEDIAANRATVQRMQNGVMLTLHNKGLFSSGSAVVSSSYAPMLRKIASALGDLPGPIVVSGAFRQPKKFRPYAFLPIGIYPMKEPGP